MAFKPDPALEIEIEGENYRLDAVPVDTSSVVVAEKEKLLGAVDLKTLINDLSRVAAFIRIASNGVGAAGPKFAQLQIEIQRLGYDLTKLCDKSALTVANFKNTSSTVLTTDLLETLEYLLENLEEIAIETLSTVSKIAGKMEKAALELHYECGQKARKMVEALEYIQREQCSAVKMEKSALELHHDFHQGVAVGALHHSIGALKELSVVMMQASHFWKQMYHHCHSLADSEMQQLVEKVMKRWIEEKWQKVWTSKMFKRNTVWLNAGWVALHSVCSVYIEQIEQLQRDLYQYLKENPTWEESRMNLKSLAETFLSDLKQEQKAIYDMVFKAEKEIKTLQEYEASELNNYSDIPYHLVSYCRSGKFHC